MKTLNKIVSLSILSLALNQATFAATQGPYIGVGAGGSILSDFSDATKTDNNLKFAGKVFAGFNFNKWLGIELNYAKYGDTEYTVDDTFDTVSSDYSIDAISLVGKAYLLLDPDSKLSAYGLLGASYLTASADTKFMDVHVSDDTSHTYSPTIGAGFQYRINQHLTTSLEYTYVRGKNGSSDQIGIPDANLLTMNIAFNL